MCSWPFSDPNNLHSFKKNCALQQRLVFYMQSLALSKNMTKHSWWWREWSITSTAYWMVMPVLLGEVVVVHGLDKQRDGGLLLGDISSVSLFEEMARKAKARGQPGVPPRARGNRPGQDALLTPIFFGPENVASAVPMHNKQQTNKNHNNWAQPVNPLPLRITEFHPYKKKEVV